MKPLTTREEEIMRHFWTEGPMFVRQLLEKYSVPKPHFNTLSTYVRALEEKGFLGHESFGSTYRYFAIVSEDEYSGRTLSNVANKYFENSYLNIVSSLIKDEKLSIDEIRKLIDEVANNQK